LLSTNLRFVIYANDNQEEASLHRAVSNRRIDAHRRGKSPDGGGWRLFGLWRDKEIAVFVEAARGGVREWSGLDYLASFCASCGISLWEIHNKVEQKLPN
jgi:hypothetical protein